MNPGQVGHWLCDDYEFVRKKTEKGDVLIELNTSTVVEHSEPIPGGGREFTFHRRKGILGDEGVAKFSALVPDAAEDPVRVTTNDTSHPGVGLAGIASATTEKQECVPVPPVQVIR